MTLRLLIQDVVVTICEKIANRSYSRTFETEGDSYLSRYLLFQVGDIAVQLHKFHRGDQDVELHNHPWKWAVSLILAGGYREERKIGESNGANVWTKTFRPGSINLLRGDAFHRVDMLDAQIGCWTLFVSGPKTQSWSFWNRKTGELTPWRNFLAITEEIRRARREAMTSLGGST